MSEEDLQPNARHVLELKIEKSKSDHAESKKQVQFFLDTHEQIENHLNVLGRSLVEACNEGDIGKVRKLLNEGRVSVHDTTEEGESLLSLACSAGYFELAQVGELLNLF